MSWYASKSVDSGNNTGWNISTNSYWIAYNSIDSGNNSGWIFFSIVSPNVQSGSRDANRVPTLLGGSSSVLGNTIKLRVNPSTHAIKVGYGTYITALDYENSPRDKNRVPAFLGVSSSDGVTPVVAYADYDTGDLLIQGS